MRRLVIMTAMVFLMMVLSACFRDASSNQDNPTSIPISNFINTPTDAPPTGVPVATLTSTPPLEPSSTFPVGGPPVESNTSDSENGDSEAVPAGDGATLPPTLPIPSFTPRGSLFGDSGITPTGQLPTQPIPDALITPTGFPEEEKECVYFVQPNDTLFSIATALEVTVDDMIAINADLAFNPNTLSIGQELAIPGCVPGAMSESPPDGSQTPAAATSTPAQPNECVYVVKEGDTLTRIATGLGVSVEEMLAANAALAANPNALAIGQELVVPNCGG